MNLRLVVVLLTSFSFTLHHTISFSLSQPTVNTSKRHLVTRKNMNSQGCDMSGHPSTLPGDPSLNLVTNVDLGDKKLEIMKGWLFFLLLNLNTKLCISHQSILCLYIFFTELACSKAIQAATGKPEAYIGKSDQIFMIQIEKFSHEKQ